MLIVSKITVRKAAFHLGPGYTDTFSFEKANDIVPVSPPVRMETMKTIRKTQTFEYANQGGLI